MRRNSLPTVLIEVCLHAAFGLAVCHESDQIRAGRRAERLALQGRRIPGLVGTDPGELYLGASHGSELSFVFGTSPQFATDTASAGISKLMQRCWTRFAAAGDPNGGSDLAWPKFTATSNQRMQFTLTPSVVTDFRAAECTFWIGLYESQFGAGVVSAP